MSTNVFRINADNSIFYLRIRDNNDTNILFEINTYKLLKSLDVKVPDVIYFEESSKLFGAPFMIVTEISGEPLYTDNEAVQKKVLFEAGKDLATVNRIQGDGFGWITEMQGLKIKANYQTYSEFTLNEIDSHVKAIRDAELVTESESQAIENLISSNTLYLDYQIGHLAHGDFDLSHIYHMDDVYTGIIDFGDIRVSSIYYDIAHLYLYSGQKPMDYLLEGYSTIIKLPEDFLSRVKSEAFFIAMSKLAWIVKNIPKDEWGSKEVDFISGFIKDHS